MTDQKTLELRVKAQLDGVKDLKAVSEAISEIEKAIEKQTAAAKRGENVYDELKGSLEALVLVQKDLKGQVSLVKEFRDLEKAISGTETRVSNATKQYDEFKKKIEEAGKVTDAQQTKLINYSKALDTANSTLARQRANRETLTKAFTDAGIAIDQLAVIEQRNLGVQADLGVVYQRNQAALKSYSATVREAREAERARSAQAAESARQEQQRIGVINAQIADARRRNSEQEAAALVQQKRRLEIINAQVADARAREAQARATSDASAVREQQQRLSVLNAQIGTAQKRAAEAASQANKDAGLKRAAADAEKAAKSYNTLARAATSLVPKQQSLRSAIDDIINPGEKARSTLAGVEKEIEDLTKTIGSINGPVAEYRENLNRLSATQKSIAQQASLVDSFRRQTEALRAARAEYVQARSQVNEYAAAVRQGGEAGQQFVKALAEAQVRAKAAAQAVAQQVAVTRQTRDALRGAGIATNDLAGAQQRLSAAARAGTTATTQLTSAVRQYGVESEVASRRAARNGLFGDEGRTTLSLIQRIRGEILALAAAYVGLQGTIRLAGDAIEKFKTRQSSKIALGVGLGTLDRTRIDSEYEYLKEQADRIGISYEVAAEQYGKFLAASSQAGRVNEETRFIFETFAEAGRVFNLSDERVKGTFLALEQIVSKGKLTAEELRRQLGDRLPGIFGIAQRALQDSFPDLDKALAEGKVGSENLIRIAQEYRKVVAEQLPEAVTKLGAAQARLNNEVTDFKLAVADAGFADSYSEAVEKISEFLRGNEGKELAKSIAEGFKSAAEAVVTLLNNLDTVKTVLKVIAGLWAIAFARSVITSIIRGYQAIAILFTTLGKGVVILRNFAAAFPLLSTLVTGALGAVASFFLGFKAGEWARREFRIVREAATWLVTGVAEAFAFIKGAFEISMAAIPVLARNAFATFINVITFAVRKALGIFSAFAAATGLDSLSRTIDGIASSLEVGYADIGSATAKARQNIAREVAQIRAIRNDMLAADALDSKVGPTPRGSQADVRRIDNALARGRPTPDPGFKPKEGPTGPTEAEINKRARQIEEITRALESLDAKIDRSQTETLSNQLSAIDTQYAALARKIERLGGAEAKGFLAQLTGLTNELRKITADKFNAALLKERESLEGKLDQLDAAAGRKEKLNLEARQNAIRLQYQDLYRELADLRLKFFNNDRDTSEIDQAKERLDSGVQELLNLEARKFAQEELNRLEGRQNELIKLRDAQIEAVNAQRAGGLIQEEEAVATINRINQQALPGIQAAFEATRLWAIENAKIFNSPEDQAIFLATLDATLVKVQTVKTEFTSLENTIIQGGINAVNSGLNLIVDGLQNIFTGQQSIGDGFRGMLAGFAQFAAQFLRDIAIMIIKMKIFKALQASGNPVLAAIGTAGLGSMGVRHSGGVIGSPGGRTRRVPNAWFANAPRYHSGGVMGLASDEYPTILQRGEEVLSKDSPRNIMNGGGMPQAQATGQGMRFVLVDDRSRIPEAMAGAEGDQVIIQSIRKNASTIKQFIK